MSEHVIAWVMFSPFSYLTLLGINAFAYMVVARLIYFLLPEQKVFNVNARWLAKGFVTADVVSFLVQAAGGSMLADQNDKDKARLGQKVYMAGIAVQLVFVIIFILVSIQFQRRLSNLIKAGKLDRPTAWVQPLVWTIFAVLALIMVKQESPDTRRIPFSPKLTFSLAGANHFPTRRVQPGCFS